MTSPERGWRIYKEVEWRSKISVSRLKRKSGVERGRLALNLGSGGGDGQWNGTGVVGSYRQRLCR